MFSGGSNNLSVEVSDDNVLEATIDAGKIKIKTKKEWDCLSCCKG